MRSVRAAIHHLFMPSSNLVFFLISTIRTLFRILGFLLLRAILAGRDPLVLLLRQGADDELVALDLADVQGEFLSDLELPKEQELHFVVALIEVLPPERRDLERLAGKALGNFGRGILPGADDGVHREQDVNVALADDPAPDRAVEDDAGLLLLDGRLLHIRRGILLLGRRLDTENAALARTEFLHQAAGLHAHPTGLDGNGQRGRAFLLLAKFDRELGS